MIARVIVILAVVLGAVSPAHAASPNDIARAREYFETGRLLFDQGDYDVAAKKFLAGYELVQRPQFLLNIGLCFQKLGQLEEARLYYQRFLSETPADDPDRGRAQQWMGEVEAKLAERAKSAPPPPPPAPTTTSPPAPATPAPATASRPRLDLTATPEAPAKKSFFQRNWWIFPVAGAVVAGVAVGIYFAARPSNPCPSDIRCLDLRH